MVQVPPVVAPPYKSAVKVPVRGPVKKSSWESSLSFQERKTISNLGKMGSRGASSIYMDMNYKLHFPKGSYCSLRL